MNIRVMEYSNKDLTNNFSIYLKKECLYHGEGHIINIAKRHTNRRWRQYTPQKQCNILLQLLKPSMVHSVELKGFGTFIAEISFKDINNEFVTQLKYNLKFSQQNVNQMIVCDKEVKFVDLKLINDQNSPKRMGINHFFMKGQVIKKDGQQSDHQEEQKKKKKRGSANQIWVRQKIQGEDPWGLDQDQNDQDNELKIDQKRQQCLDKRKSRAKKVQNKQEDMPQTSVSGHCINFKRQYSPNLALINQSSTSNNDNFSDILKNKKRNKLNQIQDIKLQLPKGSNQLKVQKGETFLKKFEQKYNLKPMNEKQTQEQQIKDNDNNQRQKVIEQNKQQVSEIKQSEQQTKRRVKQQLIKKLQARMKVMNKNQ